MGTIADRPQCTPFLSTRSENSYPSSLQTVFFPFHTRSIAGTGTVHDGLFTTRSLVLQELPISHLGIRPTRPPVAASLEPERAGAGRKVSVYEGRWQLPVSCAPSRATRAAAPRAPSKGRSLPFEPARDFRSRLSRAARKRPAQDHGLPPQILVCRCGLRHAGCELCCC
jgi:hypothetical protein